MKIILSESTLKLIKEYFETSEDEYWDALKEFFKEFTDNPDQFIHYMDMNDKNSVELFEDMHDEEAIVKTISTDGKNLIIKYGEFSNSKLLIILGIVKRRNLNRSDLKSFHKIITLVLEKLKNRYRLTALANSKSLNFIKKIQEVGNKKGMNLQLETEQGVEFPLPLKNVSPQQRKELFKYTYAVLYHA